MKTKFFSGLFVFAFILGSSFQAIADFEVSNFSLQKRVYEDGGKSNRIAVELKDENGNYISEDRIHFAILTDPNGKKVKISPLRLDKATIWNAYYDGNKSQWIYDENRQYHNSYYGIIKDNLINGTYTLTLKYHGIISKATYNFNKSISIPIVYSYSIKPYFDEENNLLVSWKIPENMYTFASKGIETSIIPLINIYNNETYIGELYVKQPSHLGQVFIPLKIINLVKGYGNKFQLCIQARTNDNNNRSYSNLIDLAL